MNSLAANRLGPILVLAAVLASPLPAMDTLGSFTRVAHVEVPLGADFYTVTQGLKGFCYGNGYLWGLTWWGYLVRIDPVAATATKVQAAGLVESPGAICWDDRDGTLWIAHGSTIQQFDTQGQPTGSSINLALLGGGELYTGGEFTAMVKDTDGFWLLQYWVPMLFKVDFSGQLLAQLPNCWYDMIYSTFALVNGRLVKMTDRKTPAGDFMDGAVLSTDPASGLVTDVWEYPWISNMLLGVTAGGGYLWTMVYTPGDTVAKIDQLLPPGPSPFPAPPSDRWGDFRVADWDYLPVMPSMIEGLYGFGYDPQARRLYLGDGIGAFYIVQDADGPRLPLVLETHKSYAPHSLLPYDLAVIGDSVWITHFWRGITLPKVMELKIHEDGAVDILREWETGFSQSDGLATNGQAFWVSGRTSAPNTGMPSNEIKMFDPQGNEIAHFYYPDEDACNYEDLTWHQGGLWAIAHNIYQETAEIQVLDPATGAILHRYPTGWRHPHDNAKATLASDGENLLTFGVVTSGPYDSFQSYYLRLLRLRLEDPPVPAAPSGLTAIEASAGRIDLKWLDNSDDETGFTVERKTGSRADWEVIHVVGAGVTTFADTGLAAATRYAYRVFAHNAAGDSAYSNEAAATTIGRNGNFTIGGYLGIGTDAPERAVHVRGGNAVFRMDRNQDTAAFMLVRDDGAGHVQKCFVAGVNAAGADNGSFVINDLGAATSGGGTNRLTIDTGGAAAFAGQVRATGFFTPSSRRLKQNIRPIDGALESVTRLQGRRFTWLDGGEPSVGLIAEETAAGAPELIAFASGRAAGVDYGRLTALLLEGLKCQQAELDALRQQRDRLGRLLDELASMKDRLQK